MFIQEAALNVKGPFSVELIVQVKLPASFDSEDLEGVIVTALASAVCLMSILLVTRPISATPSMHIRKTTIRDSS